MENDKLEQLFLLKKSVTFRIDFREFIRGTRNKKTKKQKQNFTGDKCHLLLLPYQGRRREHMGFMKKHFGHGLA